MRLRRRSMLASLVLVVTLASVAGAESFEFQRLNRSFSGEAAALDPIRQGPLTLRLTSGRQVVALRRHRLELSPAGSGLHAARLEVEFLGKADLQAEVDVGGAASRLEDEVIVPLQTRTLEGRVRLERARDGFVFTAVELPPTFEVDISSRLGNQLLTLCDQMTILLAGLDCSGFARSLTRVSLPLPAPGETFELPDAELAPEERAALQRYLAR